MRIKLHEQLEDLTNQLALMCHLAGEAIESATDALVRADLPLAERVFDLTEQIERLHGPCEEQAMALLALQASERAFRQGLERQGRGVRNDSWVWYIPIPDEWRHTLIVLQSQWMGLG